MEEHSFREWLFIQKQEGMSLHKLMNMIGLKYNPPQHESELEAYTEQMWTALISMGEKILDLGPEPRRKMNTVSTIQNVLDLLHTSSKIMVLSGAGMSVACGIPDFRSENGIYSRLEEYDLPSPECMFDIRYFNANPEPFFAFAKELFPKSEGFSYVPSRSHYFLKLLQDKGKLKRVYSQNIDMLEAAAGVDEEHCVLCHGSFATATCLSCRQTIPGNQIRQQIAEQVVPTCSECEHGIMKPDIVFFGEQLPDRFHRLIAMDQDDTDLVIVIGSSLNVDPVRGIISRIPPSVPMILINRETVGQPHEFDVELLGNSDDIIQQLCATLEWTIPVPDATMFHQGIDCTLVQPSSENLTLSYTCEEPSRYLFKGAIKSTRHDSESDSASSCSSTADEHVGSDENVAALDSSILQEDLTLQASTDIHENAGFPDSEPEHKQSITVAMEHISTSDANLTSSLQDQQDSMNLKSPPPAPSSNK